MTQEKLGNLLEKGPGVDGFDEVVAAAGGHAAAAFVGAGAAGEGDDGDVGAIGAAGAGVEVLDEVDAAAVGQAEVEQDEGGTGIIENGKRLCGGAGFADAVARVLEQEADRLAQERIVLNEEDGRLGVHGRSLDPARGGGKRSVGIELFGQKLPAQE